MTHSVDLDRMAAEAETAQFTLIYLKVFQH